MTLDEIKAMLVAVVGEQWRATITYAVSKPPLVITFTIVEVQAQQFTVRGPSGEIGHPQFPSNIIEARPGYLHYTGTNGNDIVLEKMPCSSS